MGRGFLRLDCGRIVVVVFGDWESERGFWVLFCEDGYIFLVGGGRREIIGIWFKMNDFFGQGAVTHPAYNYCFAWPLLLVVSCYETPVISCHASILFPKNTPVAKSGVALSDFSSSRSFCAAGRLFDS